jgi:glutamine amidotransferase
MMGVCLGMQLLFETSEEFGINNGLGFINGDVNPSTFNEK